MWTWSLSVPRTSRIAFYLNRYTVVSEAINDARDMINEPGSVATPEYLAETARRIAKEVGLEVKVWDEKKLEKEGYNGLLQVGRGSSNPPRLIRLLYRTKKSRGHLAFVGKGVTFDTGGISIEARRQNVGNERGYVRRRGSNVCDEGHRKAEARCECDRHYSYRRKLSRRQCSAAGRHLLCKERQVDHGGQHRCGRPADPDRRPALASEGKPTHILDIATLTGAVVRALGVSIAGVMGNNPDSFNR